jgi:Domain of unknown function (DUF1877)
MSMIGNLKRITEDQLFALRRDPDSIENLIQDFDSLGARFHPLMRLDGTDLCIDKSWHGLHYLLNRDQGDGHPPLNFLLKGVDIGTVDVGYGPAYAHSAGSVQKLRLMLSSTSFAELVAKINPTHVAAAGLYGLHGIEAKDVLEAFQGLAPSFEELVQFVSAAADSEHALLVWIN